MRDGVGDLRQIRADTGGAKDEVRADIRKITVARAKGDGKRAQLLRGLREVFGRAFIPRLNGRAPPRTADGSGEDWKRPRRERRSACRKTAISFRKQRSPNSAAPLFVCGGSSALLLSLYKKSSAFATGFAGFFIFLHFFIFTVRGDASLRRKTPEKSSREGAGAFHNAPSLPGGIFSENSGFRRPSREKAHFRRE